MEKDNNPMKRKTRATNNIVLNFIINTYRQHAARIAKWNLPIGQQKEKKKTEKVFALIKHLVLYFNPFSLPTRVLNANLYFIFIKRLTTSIDILAILKLYSRMGE